MQNKTLLIVTALLFSIFAHSSLLFDKGDYGGNEGEGMLTFYSVSVSPVNISVNTDKNIDLNFLFDVGEVNISVVNSAGTVFYNRNIDTTFDNYYNLEISNLPAGNYTISVNNSDNVAIKTVSFEVK